MFVRSLTWCSVTAVAILAAALFASTPVSAHADDQHNTQIQTQNFDNDHDKDDWHTKLKDPTIKIETGACVQQNALEGTIGVDITNPNNHELTYKVVVHGEEKSVTVAASSTEYIAFTELAAGDYGVEVTGPHNTKALGNATIATCHEHEQPIVSVDACGCASTNTHDGRLTLTITNPNDYAVTYTIRVGTHQQNVFVDAHDTQTVSFAHLRAGGYDIQITGDDCTRLCLATTVEQCPEQEPQPQPEPGRGGGAPSAPPVQTPIVPAAPATIVASTTTLPAKLPNTSASELTVTSQPKGNNVVSFLLIAVGLPLTAYGAIPRRKQLIAQTD